MSYMFHILSISPGYDWYNNENVVTTYYGALNSSSYTFYRRNNWHIFFYEAIQITVNVTGMYSFSCNSIVDTHGYFYVNEFDPSNISANQLASDDDSGVNAQCRITRLLETNLTYVLVVTTFSPTVTGSFSIRVSGPADASLRRINNMPTVTPSVMMTRIRSTTTGKYIQFHDGYLFLQYVASQQYATRLLDLV